MSDREKSRTRWNSTIAAAGKPLARGTKPIARSPIKRTRGKPKRFKHRRQPEYAAWIRTLRCTLERQHDCEGVVECCHYKARATGSDDYANTFPCCTAGHRDFHQRGVKSWQKKWDVDLAALCAELAQFYDGDQEAF